MTKMTYFLSLILFASLLFGCGKLDEAASLNRPLGPEQPSDAVIKTDDELQQQIVNIASEAKGKVGVYALVIETDRSVSINGSERFAMQSVVKLPISMAVLRQIDERKLTLEQKIRVGKGELVPSNMRSPIRDKNPNGTVMTVQELIRFAISESDGTAADVLQRVAGDAKGVQAYIDSLGITEMKVKYTHKEFGSEWKFQYENWVTPEAAVTLLNGLYHHEGGTKDNGDLLLKFMTESNNPTGRLKAGLPPGAILAHKTGTGGTQNGVTSATNDIGLITMPNGQHVAIAVFVGDSTADEKIREGVIAKIAKAVWDKWSVDENKVRVK